MPNGFHGSDQEWERIEAPLRALDRGLEEFARRHGMRLARSERNWPSRSLHWGRDVERLVQIYLEDANTLTWNIWICVSKDRKRKRYWKTHFLRRGILIGEIESSLAELLEQARHTAESWQSGDLEFATDLEM